MAVEHRVFLTVFDQIEGRLTARPGLAEVKFLASLVTRLLESHGEREEDLSYAALDQMLGERGPIDCLYQDHDEIDGRLAQIQVTQDLDAACRLLAATMTTARKHFQREERIIFPLIEATLHHGTLNDLGREWIHAQQIPVTHL